MENIPFHIFQEMEFSCQVFKFFSCSFPTAIQLILLMKVIILEEYKHYTPNLSIFRQKKSAHYLNLIKLFIDSFEKNFPIKQKNNIKTEKTSWLLRQVKVGRSFPPFFVALPIN